MEKYLVGIDFGACNLKAARWISGKKIPLRPLKLNKIESGNYEAPNVILYDKTKSGELEKIVGQGAKNSDDYGNRIDYVKRKLELKNWSQWIENSGQTVTAVDAAADIFAWLKAAITENKSGNEEIHAAITMPVCFSEMQKRRLFEALRAAKIPVQNIITEPFAAMFSVQEFFADDEEKIILIFDFGGSTLDLSLIRLEQNGGRLIVEELASAGKIYGGADIDRAIYTEILAKKYPAEIAAIKAADDSDGKQATEFELTACACKLKEWLFGSDAELSVKDDAGTTFHGGTEIYRFELTLAEVEELFARQKICEQITEMLDEIFDQAEDVEKSEVTHVKAFGGTSHIRIFLELLEKYFGADIFDSAEYFDENIYDNDEFYLSAAAGAARYLAMCEENPDKVEIHSKIPFSIGVARGNKFVKYLDCNPPYGVPTKNILLNWSDLAKNNNRLALYQAFADSSNVAITGDGGAIYLGSVALQRDLYESEDIGLTMKMVSAGNLRLSFREIRGDKIFVVEEKDFRIGEEIDG